MTVELAESTGSTFGTFLRSAGKLALARQASGLVFVGAVLALPTLAARGVATDFVWAYFAMMTLTSLLGCGLERLAGTVTAERGSEPLGRALAPVLVARLWTFPLAAVGLWVMLTFVGVALSPAAWLGTFVWIAAGLVGPSVFAALRSAGNSTVEPVVLVAVRIAQTVSLVTLANAGASVAVLVGVVALLETVAVACGLAVIGRPRDFLHGPSVRTLPLRRASLLGGIEVVGVLNIRADLLLVGRILGAGPGAVYGLLYRVVDGFTGIVASAGLWLYAETANGNDGGEDARGIRARSLRLLPRLGIALGLVVILVAGQFGAVFPELSGHIATLRVLVIAFPLLTVNSIELYVRSGRGRNAEVLLINSMTLVVNVGLCVWLLSTIGLVGGAIALAVSEFLQAVVLLVSASSSERRMVAPATGVSVLGAVSLAATAIAMTAGTPVFVVAGVLATCAVVFVRLPVRGRTEMVPA
jgi:O-antigen/teichoic acid export membrane protein